MDEEGAGTRVAVVITPVTSAIGVNLEVHPTPVGQLQELLPWFRLLHLCGGKLAHTGLLVSLWLCDGIKIGGSGNTAPSNDKYDGMGSDGLEAIRQGINKKGPIFMALWKILEAIGLRIGVRGFDEDTHPFVFIGISQFNKANVPSNIPSEMNRLMGSNPL